METETINFETEMEITILQTAARQSKTTQYLLYRTIDKNPLIRTIFLWDECILITERQCNHIRKCSDKFKLKSILL